MKAVFLCGGWRTPIGRYGGCLSSIRPDDLLATTFRALMTSFPPLQNNNVDEIFVGCSNQAGEDSRNVARMSALLAGLPVETPAVTLNRLCGSGLDAVGAGLRAIQTGAAHVVLAGGVESMSRAPLVQNKSETPFARHVEIFDTTIGWRFINPLMEAQYGVESMGETAENLAEAFNISRADQDALAYRSQMRVQRAQKESYFAREICPVPSPLSPTTPSFDQDEQPRPPNLEKLAALPPLFRQYGSVTAGNSSSLNDGAAAVLLVSEEALKTYGWTPLVRLTGFASAGCPPRLMGLGPLPATQKLLDRLKLRLQDFDVIELNEAFAVQVLTNLRHWGLPDDAEHVNPNGGSISLGHPLGMSGVRLILTLAHSLHALKARRGLATMCVGIGQGLSLSCERV